MKNFVLVVIFAVFLGCFTTQAIAKDQQALEARLAYLNEIPEVSWVKFKKNNVYVGFNTRPSDLSSIVGGAALFGNRAYGFGVHVWAVPANIPNWKVGDTYYCEATGRYGKVKDNDCR